MGPHTTETERWYSRKDAAELCSCDVSTLKRKQQQGELPNARRAGSAASSRVEYPLSDLVNAGLYTPPPAGEESEDALDQARAQKRVTELTVELAEVRVRAEEQSKRADSLQKQVTQLTGTVERLATACAGGGR